MRNFTRLEKILLTFLAVETILNIIMLIQKFHG